MKSNKEIQADYKKRMRTNGYVYKTLWIHRDDLEEVEKLIKNKKRLDKITGNV